jgi:hypothetical protein
MRSIPPVRALEARSGKEEPAVITGADVVAVNPETVTATVAEAAASNLTRVA